MVESVVLREDEDRTGSTFLRLPKHVRQMGTGGNCPEIYIEDYAEGYLRRLAGIDASECAVAVLVGEIVKSEGRRYVFIRGALEVDAVTEENRVRFTSELWANVYERVKRFFPRYEAVGWFLSGPQFLTEGNDELRQLHLDWFGGKDRVLYRVDAVERTSAFYLYDKGEMKKWPGYCIYFDKNEEMQGYLGAKSFRSVDSGFKDPVMEEIRKRVGKESGDDSLRGDEAGAANHGSDTGEQEMGSAAEASKHGSGTGEQIPASAGKTAPPGTTTHGPIVTTVEGGGGGGGKPRRSGSGLIAAAILLIVGALVYRNRELFSSEVRPSPTPSSVASSDTILSAVGDGKESDATARDIDVTGKDGTNVDVVGNVDAGTGNEKRDTLVPGLDQSFPEGFVAQDDPVFVPGVWMDPVTPTSTPEKDSTSTGTEDGKAGGDSDSGSGTGQNAGSGTGGGTGAGQNAGSGTGGGGDGGKTGGDAGQEVSQLLHLYIIKEGDTLADILRGYYGDTSRLKEVQELNQIINENRIYAGQELYLP